MSVCRQCGGEARRSRSRGFFERSILKRLKIHPFRCGDCGARFYKFSERGKRRRSTRITEREPAPPLGEAERQEFAKIMAEIRDKEREAGLDRERQKASAGSAEEGV